MPYQGPFDGYWAQYSNFPECLCLTLSLACTSNCIYCAGRGVDIEPRFLPLELLEKILDECKLRNFKGGISLSENGDALMHPQFREMITMIREKLPDCGITLFSNMVLMDEGIARFLLEGPLPITYLHFNIDGISQETYNYIKRNKNFEMVLNNAIRFIELRNELNAECIVGIGIVSAKKFSEDIEGKTGIFDDDTEKIIAYFKPYLLGKQDHINQDPISLEKYQSILARPKREACNLLDRIFKHAFIAPNGQVYICCADYGITSNLGNIRDKFIGEIWSSDIRRQMLKTILDQKYDGGFDICKTCLPSTGSREYDGVRNDVAALFRSGILEFVDGAMVDRRMSSK